MEKREPRFDLIELIRDNLRDKVPASRFNLRWWVGSPELPWQGHQDLSCGTVGCIMGHSVAIPEIQKLGLFLEKSTDWMNNGQGHLAYIENGETYRHMDAASLALGLPYNDADWLFNPDQYLSGGRATKDEAVQRLTDYLEHRGIPEGAWREGDERPEDRTARSDI